MVALAVTLGETQEIFGRGILRIQTHGPRRAYFMTFLPEVSHRPSMISPSKMPPDQSSPLTISLRIHPRDKWHARDVESGPCPQCVKMKTSDRPGTRPIRREKGLGDPDKLITCCLDSGCVMTLIDTKLAAMLPYEPVTIPAIPVSGIGSQHISNQYVRVPVYFIGDKAMGRVWIEAHIVDDLKAKLLVGTDVMGPEGFILHIPRSQAIIEACDNLVFPVAFHAKANHFRHRPVYAAERTEIPPHTTSYVPVRVRAKLPENRDFVIDGRSTRLQELRKDPRQNYMSDGSC